MNTKCHKNELKNVDLDKVDMSVCNSEQVLVIKNKKYAVRSFADACYRLFFFF